MATPSLQPFPIEQPDEPMAIREDIRTLVRAEVHNAVEELKPHGLRLALNWVRHVGGAAVAVALFATVLSGAIAGWVEAFHRGQSEARFEQKTTDRLADIEAEILILEAAQHPKAALQKIEALPDAELSKSLPALHAAVARPVSEVAPDRTGLAALGARLAQINANSTDYWPTVLEFIRFASNGLASNAPPPGKPNLILTNDTFVNVGQLTSPGLRIVLDGGELKNVTITGDRITFTTHPVRLINVRFVDCAFEFPNDASSSDFLRNAASQILPSIASAVVNTAGPAS